MRKSSPKDVRSSPAPSPAPNATASASPTRRHRPRPHRLRLARVAHPFHQQPRPRRLLRQTQRPHACLRRQTNPRRQTNRPPRRLAPRRVVCRSQKSVRALKPPLRVGRDERGVHAAAACDGGGAPNFQKCTWREGCFCGLKAALRGRTLTASGESSRRAARAWRSERRTPAASRTYRHSDSPPPSPAPPTARARSRPSVNSAGCRRAGRCRYCGARCWKRSSTAGRESGCRSQKGEFPAREYSPQRIKAAGTVRPERCPCVLRGNDSRLCTPLHSAKLAPMVMLNSSTPSSDRARENRATVPCLN